MDAKRTVWVTLPDGSTVVVMPDAPADLVGPLVGALSSLPLGGQVTVGVDVVPYDGGDGTGAQSKASGHQTHRTARQQSGAATKATGH